MDQSAQNFVRRSPVAVAWSSGGVALRYVVPVLWMTSRLAVMGVTPTASCSDGRERRGDTAAESDVYECLLGLISTEICESLMTSGSVSSHCCCRWSLTFNEGLHDTASSYIIDQRRLLGSQKHDSQL